jgi:hypothetical protein
MFGMLRKPLTTIEFGVAETGHPDFGYFPLPLVGLYVQRPLGSDVVVGVLVG